jgi:hypothetical protein
MPSPKRYRKKPEPPVEAVQHDGSTASYEQIGEWTGGISPGEPGIVLAAGEWVLRAENGNLYTLKHDHFQATYEPVEEVELQHEDRLRLGRLADIIGGVHRPCADPELHEDDARFLRALADRQPEPVEEGGGEGRRQKAVMTALRCVETQSEAERLVDQLTKILRPADPFAGITRPASKAHVVLTAAVLQCLEAGIGPGTVRGFVDEELQEAQPEQLSTEEGVGPSDDLIEALCRIADPMWERDVSDHTESGEILWDQIRATLVEATGVDRP